MQGELEGYVIEFCHWAAGLIKWKGAFPIVFGFIVPSAPAQDEERMGRGSAAWEMMELHLLPWNQ